MVRVGADGNRAGGRVRTGSYIDYRAPDTGSGDPGLLLHQWLGGVLQVMGVPRSEFERSEYQADVAGSPWGAGPRSQGFTGGYGPISPSGANWSYAEALKVLSDIPPYFGA